MISMIDFSLKHQLINMPHVPFYIYGLAAVINLAGVYFFYMVSARSRLATGVVVAWLALLAILGLNGFFAVTDTIPPRFLLMLTAPVFAMIIIFISRTGRRWLNRFDVSLMYLVHIIRLPVEIMLYLLLVQKLVPDIMTFENGNYDIFSGLSAPVVYYFNAKHRLPRWLLLGWNFLCLGLLANVVYHAVFSAPLPFQKFAFDQPNVAVLYFPFNWLPGFLVPLVLFCHLVCIRQLLIAKNIAVR